MSSTIWVRSPAGTRFIVLEARPVAFSFPGPRRHPSWAGLKFNYWREALKISPILSILALGLAAPALAQEAAPSAGTPETTTAQTPASEAPADAAPAAQADAAGQDSAAQAATAKAGDTIYGPAGEAVGTVESVAGENFVISTGTNKATLPLASLGTGPNGPTISMTKDQLDAAIQQAAGTPKSK